MTGGIPLFFFFWGPFLVALALWLLGRWQRKLGVVPGLGSDIDGYGQSDVRGILEHYGPDVRQAWRHRALLADVALAASYGMVGLGLYLGLLQRGVAGWVAVLCGAGWVLAAIADIAENIAHARLCDTFPRLEPDVVARASMATGAKFWLFLLGSAGAVAALILAAPRNVFVPVL
jgi:hypothetical protein